MPVHEIVDRSDYESFLKSKTRAIIFYSATWCTGCEKITSFYAKLSDKYAGRVALAHVDIDRAGVPLEQVPAFVGYRKGDEINSFEGADPYSLKALMKEVIQAD